MLPPVGIALPVAYFGSVSGANPIKAHIHTVVSSPMEDTFPAAEVDTIRRESLQHEDEWWCGETGNRREIRVWMSGRS